MPCISSFLSSPIDPVIVNHRLAVAAMEPMRVLTQDDYTVGWICALPLELAASMAMLDEEHQPLPKDRSDHNTYTLGCIGNHNVVMACLPAGKLGTSSAATVAAQMRISFRSIRFGLMVGIGGGVPNLLNDIRLGDVVVSKPGGKGGGVVQYDFGRTVGDGKFVRTGSLNAPPEVLLSALSNLQARHLIHKSNLSDHISAATVKNPEFAYLGADRDLLFESEYNHQGGRTCDKCDKVRLVKRSRRDPPVPKIHYGVIASANSVMVHAGSRDRLGKEIGALCFEMEAAGLMNTFPCVVIRGICDYSDSHKTKEWQPYAALTAAAYAKKLLCVIHVDQVSNTATMPTPPATLIPEIASRSVPTSGRVQRSRLLRSRSTQEPVRSEPTPGQLLPHSFFSRYLLFPPNSVALGRLVADRVAPEQDFCSVPVTLTVKDVDITHRPRLRETVESARGSKLFHKFASIFSNLNIDQEFPVVRETTYTLLNSGEVFKRLCDNVRTREWLQQAIKLKWPVYMVTGIHTVHESSVYNRDNSGNVSAVDPGPEQAEDDMTIGSPAAGELVFAAQYRKVQFNLSSSQRLDNAHLPVGCSNRWKVISLGGRSGFNEGDIIEASLMESFTVEDFKGREFHVMEDQIIVF